MLRVVSGFASFSFIPTIIGRQYFICLGVEFIRRSGVLRISGPQPGGFQFTFARQRPTLFSDGYAGCLNNFACEFRADGASAPPESSAKTLTPRSATCILI
jgi:hypothetical protein